MKRDSSVSAMRYYITRNGLESCFPEPYPVDLELHFYQKGEFLCHMDDPVEYFSLIIQGKASVIPTSESGRIVVLTSLKAIEMLGDIELMNHIPTLHDVCADTDLVILAVTAKLFYQLMEENLPFVQLVCGLLAKKAYQSSKQHSTTMLYPLRCRLGRYLMNEAQAADSNIITIQMLSLAKELGTSDRHLRRVLQDLIQLHIIDKKQRRITIRDMEYLQQLANNPIN